MQTIVLSVMGMILFVGNVVMGYWFYYVHSVDGLPLFLMMAVVATFSVMVMSIQIRSLDAYNIARTSTYRELRGGQFDSHVDIYSCISDACDAFFDHRYKLGYLDKFVHRTGHYTCSIHMHKKKLIVRIRDGQTNQDFLAFSYDFIRDTYTSFVDSGKIRQIADQIRMMERLYEEQEGIYTLKPKSKRILDILVSHMKKSKKNEAM